MNVDTNSQKLKVDSKPFWLGIVKMCVANLVSGLWNWLYLQNEQMELTNFLHAGTNSHKLRDDWKFWGDLGKNGSSQFVDGTLKLTVSEEWTDERNWFCAYWY